jgi:hypothetical protein
MTVEQRLAQLETILLPIVELFGPLLEEDRLSSVRRSTVAPIRIEMTPGSVESLYGVYGRNTVMPTRIELTPDAADRLYNFYIRLRVYMDTKRMTLPGHYLHHDPSA